MDRRLFTKAAGVAMIGALAGCTSVGPDSEDDAEGADDDDSATSDEDVTDESTDTDDGGADDGQDDDEQDEDDQADDGQDDDEQADGSPEDDEMSAEISMDTELEEFLDVVHHEFSWESGEGSYLCNIDLEVQNASAEVQNASADNQIQFEAIGEIVAEDGAVLAGDRTRFLLDPEETGTFTFSVDQCADATGYQLTFNAEYVPTESE